MGESKLHILLVTLEETALKMRETSEEMRKMSDHPNIQNHGSEMRGASEMVEEWIDGIKADCFGGIG